MDGKVKRCGGPTASALCVRVFLLQVPGWLEREAVGQIGGSWPLQPAF